MRGVLVARIASVVCARAGRARHFGHHHDPGTGQRGLRGREGHHVQQRHRHAGRRRLHRQEPCRGGRLGVPPPPILPILSNTAMYPRFCLERRLRKAALALRFAHRVRQLVRPPTGRRAAPPQACHCTAMAHRRTGLDPWSCSVGCCVINVTLCGLQAATSAPLIERSIERATGIVYNITGGRDLTLQEVNRRAPLFGLSLFRTVANLAWLLWYTHSAQDY